MSTSVIDYIFRELALSYLGRTDLVQVKPEDLLGDTVGRPNQAPAYDDEEVEEEDFHGLVPGRAHEDHTAFGFDTAQSTLPFEGGAAVGSPTWNLEHGLPAAPSPQGSLPLAVGSAAVVARPSEAGELRTSTSELIEKVRQARLKGYEGDPCGNCGAFTLVRNGVCLKCDSCGETSGCS
jgi:ribonucleoside-diphosphate reductase alpha chain